MGVDIMSIGLKHNLSVKSPLIFFKDLSELYNINIKVTIWSPNEGCDKVLHYEKKEDGLEDVILWLPFFMDDYIPDFSNIKSISSDVIVALNKVLSEELGFYQLELSTNTEISIYEKHVEIMLLHIGIYRYRIFYSYFTKGDLSNTSIFDIENFRKEVYKYCQVLGCKFAIYYPDTIHSSSELSDYFHMNQEDLLEYIYSKAKMQKDAWNIVSVSSFLKGDRVYFNENPFIDCFIDDFKDLEENIRG